MKKVLIIAYYWPPSGGSGVQRWLKFVKYLPGTGWNPVVYTVENGEFPVIDTSLEKSVPESVTVLRQPAWEPYSIYKKLLGREKESKFGHGFVGEKNNTGFRKILFELMVWLRGNFFIPDARMFWIRPSVNYLDKYLQENKIDYIVSTGPPHSSHLIARKLAKRHTVKWVADFRDPWTEIYYFKDLKLTFIAKAIHKYLEKRVLLESDAVLCVGPNMKENLAALVKEKDIRSKIKVISNGYDNEDRPHTAVTTDTHFSFLHVGVFSPTQNHKALWDGFVKAIHKVPELKKDLKIRMIGKIDSQAENDLINRGLPYEITGYTPHHEILRIEQQSQVLLLSLSTGKNTKELISGKIFEYLLANRPILCIGPPDGDAAEIIRSTHSGTTCNYTDTEGIADAILQYYAMYKEDKLHNTQRNVERFSRENLTAELSEFLNSL